MQNTLCQIQRQPPKAAVSFYFLPFASQYHPGKNTADLFIFLFEKTRVRNVVCIPHSFVRLAYLYSRIQRRYSTTALKVLISPDKTGGSSLSSAMVERSGLLKST